MVESLGSPFVARLWSRLSRGGASGAVVLALAACGGSSGDPCGLSLTCSSPGGGGTGSGPVGTVAASDLTLVLSAQTLPSGGGETVKATVSAVDANRNLLPGIPITVSVDANATAAVSSPVTDSAGVVTANVGVGADRTNRVITVRATSGSLVRTASIQVLGTKIGSVPLPATLVPGASGAVRFRLTDSNDVPIPQQTLTVRGVGGVETSGTTDLNGAYIYNYTAPATAGNIAIVASVGTVSVTETVQVQTVAAIAAADPNVESASVSLSASVVATNSSVTNNQVEVRALFVRATNQPTPRVRVRFDLNGDANDVGGTFASGTNIVYSNAVGIASTSFVPGVRSSPTDGVTIRTCWDYNDFDLGTCPNRILTPLTVVSEPLSVVIGTDEIIVRGPTEIDYVKRYLIQVNNAAGAPVAGTALSAIVDLSGYATGQWVPVGINWEYAPVLSCDNEDLNRNGVNERYSNGAVEDANDNARLDPPRAAVVVSFEGSSTTDVRGQAVLRISYPPSMASWVAFRLDVQAVGVGGSEGRAGLSGMLPVRAVDVIGDTKLPPPPIFVQSPFNMPFNLTPIAATNPDGKTGMLCTKTN